MSSGIRRIRFTPTERYLGNPHKGCCTFQRFNGDPLNAGEEWDEHGPTVFPPAAQPVADGYLPSTVAYCQWFSETLEPAPGRYDFSMIDQALAVSAARGQTLAIRAMAHGASTQAFPPDWYVRACPTEVLAFNDYPPGPVPMYDGPEYFEHFGNLLRALGQRYDGHPNLESVDGAFFGPWGEGAGTYGAARVRDFVELFRAAFPNTLRLALLEGEQLPLGVKAGSGWRCDCFGDLRQRVHPTIPPRLTWNHTFDCYPRQIIKARVQNAWQSAPVCFESCWVPALWHREGFDLDFIMAQGLKFHGTYFMPKSNPIPGPWLERMAAFCRQLGYRFLLRQVYLDLSVKPGASFRVEAWVENVGVAPLYHAYVPALRLRQGDRQAVVHLAEDVRTWLPGDAWIEGAVALPEGFCPGPVEVALARVAPGGEEPRVRFAIAEQEPSGWVSLGPLEVERAG